MCNIFSRSSGRIRFVALLFLAASSLVPLYLWADAPVWWAQRGVLNPSATADDYAAVNQGQVKNIAKQAYEELRVRRPTGAGSTLDAIWAAPATSTDDYQAINLGQLKNVAKPFYDRLMAEGFASGYPWVSSTASPDDYALANIGQVKNLFSFAVPGPPTDSGDANSNWLLDTWEMTYFGNLDQVASGDGDGDGLSNIVEQAAGSNPTVTAASVSPATLSFVIYSP